MVASIPQAIVSEIEAHAGLPLKHFTFSSGGCINHGGKVATLSDVFFLKWNDRQKFPDMFAAEARGLALLAEARALKIPKVVYAGTTDAFQFLMMEYIDEGARAGNYWREFGSGLALLHKHSSRHFGLDHNNYIGSLPQLNKETTSWVEFFIEQRLKVQLEFGRDQGKIDGVLLKKFEALFIKLPSLLPDELPALLHGDLWSGNLMTASDGVPCLIDPAVCYGHREMDLAMTQLFGGFDRLYLDSYNDAYPLLPGYEERFGLYNLYPLLVHVNLFGGGYKAQVVEVLRRFV